MITRVNILFGLLLAICAAVGAVMVTAETPGGRGVAHAQFSAMLQGGQVLVPTRIVILGWTFGVLQIAVYVTCMTLGISRSEPPLERPRGLFRQSSGLLLYLAGTLAYLGAFTQMVRADRAAAVSDEVGFLGPFPAATTWMLFGLWAAPLLFVAAYLSGFSRWIVSDDDLGRFEKLVSRHQRESETTS